MKKETTLECGEAIVIIWAIFFVWYFNLADEFFREYKFIILILLAIIIWYYINNFFNSPKSGLIELLRKIKRLANKLDINLNCNPEEFVNNISISKDPKPSIKNKDKKKKNDLDLQKWKTSIWDNYESVLELIKKEKK